MKTPTVGRILHFHRMSDGKVIDGPYPAHVCRVWSPEIVNAVVLHDGTLGTCPMIAKSVPVFEGVEAAQQTVVDGDFCIWPQVNGGTPKPEPVPA